MSHLARFGVSLEKELLTKFDRHIKEKNYPTRSKAIADLIRESLVKKEWIEGREVVGAITLVYNHNRRELVNRLTDVQHDFHHIIISSQHVHLDEDNCVEIVIVRGRPREVEKLAYNLKSTKGVKHGSLTMATTGKEIA
ncbi:nickel-responsive transcriptional regulator NikR [bacterium]|jgi:CopG family nickel-responsive transcriptional regulator|nr:nickel-responsive transcriptional regulator NikR [bacterium]